MEGMGRWDLSGICSIEVSLKEILEDLREKYITDGEIVGDVFTIIKEECRK